MSLLSPGAEATAEGCGSDAWVVVTDGRMSGTVIDGAVGGAGVASVTVWIDSGRVFTVWDTTGAC